MYEISNNEVTCPKIEQPNKFHADTWTKTPGLQVRNTMLYFSYRRA
jgi:hypothetical protein